MQATDIHADRTRCGRSPPPTGLCPNVVQASSKWSTSAVGPVTVPKSGPGMPFAHDAQAHRSKLTIGWPCQAEAKLQAHEDEMAARQAQVPPLEPGRGGIFQSEVSCTRHGRIWSRISFIYRRQMTKPA